MREKLQEDLKNAMKAKDQLKVLTLRGVIAELKLAEINSQSSATEEQCLAVIQKEIKKRRDANEFAQKANRADMIAQNDAEIAVLQSYLGEQFSEAKLREVIMGYISTGADNVGKIMGALSKDHKGKFEGKMASTVAKELLG